MKKLITDEELQVMLEDILKTISVDTLLETPEDSIQQASIPQQKRITKPIVKKQVAPINQQPKKVIKKIQPKQQAVKKPTVQTTSSPADKSEPGVKKLYNPVQAKEKQQLSKTQYQIFNIKMRLGKLALNDALRRFAQSLHDFDINITKNSKDKNEIKSYLSPAQGNLIALKGALESLESEFNELEKLLETE